jgi:hypothetical protein
MFLPVTESLRRLGLVYLVTDGDPQRSDGFTVRRPGLYQVGGSVLRVSAQGAQQESLAFGSVFHHGRTLLPNM